MRSLLIRLYPARWRVRYADEFEATLEEIALGPFDVVDILLGALDAHLRMQARRAAIPQERGLSMSLRLGGLAAILVGAVFASAWLLSAGLLGDFGPVDVNAQVILGLTGAAALLVAVLGLSRVLSRANPVLAWSGVAIPAIGTLIFIVGIIGSAVLALDGFWDVGMVGVFAIFVGSTLFAVATYRAAILSRAASALLAFGSVVAVALMVNVLSGYPLGPLTGPVGIAALIAIPLGWAGLGVHAIRLDRPTTAVRAA